MTTDTSLRSSFFRLRCPLSFVGRCPLRVVKGGIGHHSNYVRFTPCRTFQIQHYANLDGAYAIEGSGVSTTG